MYYGEGADVESQKENLPDSTDADDGTTQDADKKDIKRTQEGTQSSGGGGGIKRTHEDMEKGIYDEEGHRIRLDINAATDEYRNGDGDEFDPFFNQRITRGCK